MRLFCQLFLLSTILVAIGCENSLLDRSLLFATNTTIGLEAAVNPADSSSPAKVIIGYKRHEGVINPVYYNHNAPKIVENRPDSAKVLDKRIDDYYRDKAYSVLAKFRGEIGAEAADSAKGNVSASQWFATGQAADILAKQPGIAGAISGMSKVEVTTRSSLAGVKDEQSRSFALAAITLLEAMVQQMPSDSPKRDEIIGLLDKVGKTASIPDSIEMHILTGTDLEKDPRKHNLPTSGFSRVKKLREHLVDSLADMNEFLGDTTKKYKSDGAASPARTEADVAKVAKQVGLQQMHLSLLESSLENNQDLIKAIILIHENVLTQPKKE